MPEYCPTCKAVQNMRVTMHRLLSEPHATRSYHCEHCNTFIRSENIPAPTWAFTQEDLK